MKLIRTLQYTMLITLLGIAYILLKLNILKEETYYHIGEDLLEIEKETYYADKPLYWQLIGNAIFLGLFTWVAIF